MRGLIWGALAAGALAFSAQAHDSDMKKSADSSQSQLLQKMHKSNLKEIKMGGLAQQNGGDEVRSYGKMLTDDHKKADVELLDLASRLGVSMASADKMDMDKSGRMDTSDTGKADKKTRSDITPDENRRKTGMSEADRMADNKSDKMTDKTDSEHARKSTTPTTDDQMESREHKMARKPDIDRSSSPDEMKAMDDMKKLSGREFDRAFLTDMVKDHEKDISEVKDARKSMNSSDPLAQLIDKTLPTLEKHLSVARRDLAKISPQARRPY